MLTATALGIVGFGLACWLVFTLVVHALPASVGILAGLFAYRTGSGPIGAALVGLIAGALALVLGQTLFASTRSTPLRMLVAAGYAAPAAVAGYHAVHGLVAAGAPSDLWRELLAVSGALVCAVVAWSRVSTLHPGSPTRDAATTRDRLG